jgi:hypothetical protein
MLALHFILVANCDFMLFVICIDNAGIGNAGIIK